MLRILIAIPTYDRRVDVDIVRGILDLERTQKYHLDLIFPISSHISRNRNYAVTQFLKGNYQYLLFWDSDIGISGDFIQSLLDVGYKYDAKVMCGAYVKKDITKTEYVYGIKEGDDYKNPDRAYKDGLIDAGGTGIMLIAREVLERMQDPWFTILDGKNLYCFPEDWEFSRKARELGFKVGLATGFKTTHYGNYPFTHEPRQ